MPSFSRLSLTKQISSASILVILLTMFVLTMFVSVTGTRTAIQTGHAELNQQARSVQQMLDGYFKAVNLRAERQLNMLDQWMPGLLTATSNMVDTNGVLLPELRVGDMPVNSNPQLLEEFKTLTGTEIAFLAVHQGRVYRASTLLKKDGKLMNGSEISVEDPVTKHLLEGKDFSGLVFRAGKYYFLKTKVVLNEQGKAHLVIHNYLNRMKFFFLKNP